MKKILMSMFIIMISLLGCSSDENTGELPQSVTLDNDIIFTLNDQSLLDAYGQYYAEGGAILKIDFTYENPTDEAISMGSGTMKLVVDGEDYFAKSLGDDTLVDFIVEIPANSTLDASAIFPSAASYTEENEVTLEFFDFISTELGQMKLGLTQLEKQISDVTASAGEATTEGDMIVHEMGDFKVAIGNPVFMTSDEFTAKYPDALSIKNRYRYLLFDVEFENNGSEPYRMSGSTFRYTDSYGDTDTPNVVYRHMGENGFEFQEDVAAGEKRTGQIVYIVPADTEELTITSNPVEGVNSEFVYEFKFDPQV